MSKHTPTPWTFDNQDIYAADWTVVVADRPNSQAAPSGHSEWEANAAYIVRAVNAHEGLLALLERIQTHIAVGCKPERGYGTAHTELAIEIDTALSAAKE